MMDESSEAPVGPASAAEPVRPRTLTELLNQKDAKVGAFFSDLAENKIVLPSQQDFDEALEIVRSDLSLLSRVAEVARHASETELSRLPKPFLEWCADAIRASDAGLAEWMRTAGNDPHVQLRQLAVRLRSAKEKSAKAAAESCLAIGMSVVIRQFALDPLDALRAVASGLGTTGDSPKSREKAQLGKVLRRVGTSQLTNLAVVVRLLDAAVVDAHQLKLDAEAARQELYDKNLKLKADLDASSNRVSDLAAEVDRLRNEVAQLNADIEGVRGDADHGEIELKARYRTMLLRRLRPYLSDAAEALQADPPFPDVASERVKLGLAEISKEQEWLDRS